MNLQKLHKIISEKRTERKILRRKISEDKKARNHLQTEQINTEQARALIQKAGIITQQQLQYHISDIVSLALDGVFEDPYELVLQFQERRNQTECDILFKRNGELLDPLEASGFGAVDIASFALRVACWSMQMPRSSGTIILDEPMKNLSKDRQSLGGKILKELSNKLGIQFIIVTHEDELTSYADKIFTVKMKDYESQVHSKDTE